MLKILVCAVLIPIGLIAAPPAQKAESGYVGSKTCANCHQTIYAEYEKTAMGRSLVAASDTRRLAPANMPLRVASGGINYELSRRSDDLYQTESQQDGLGKDIFRISYKLEYAIGSGVNGITYAIRRGSYLFEAPLSYYARTRTWELSPGYENENTGFSRTIPGGCVACHSGRARAVADADGLYRDPPFEEMAIGCENCHGPGERHVTRPVRATIVNPARLSPQIASEICMNCHEAGDTRVFQDGKSNSDFRPGSRLSGTVAILKIPPHPADASADLLEHNFSMMLSRCYRTTNGRMGCLTCHDPHSTPAGSNAGAYYQKRCLTCHTVGSCTLPLAERQHEAAGCIACHMPRKDIGFIAHSALTNHRIVRRPGAPLPDAAYGMTTPELPDLIYLDRTDDKLLSPLMLLQAYGELADRAPQYRDRYIQTLDRVAHSVDSPTVEAALGLKAFREGGANGNRPAVEHLSKAVDGGFRSASAFEALAAALAGEGRTAEAAKTLKRGIEFFPWAPRLQKLLAVQYINAREYDLARQTLQRYLEAFPEDQFVRDLLTKVGG